MSDAASLRSDVVSVADVVATTVGPFGANKLIVEDNGTVTLTGSGAALLDRYDLDNPALSLLRTGAEGFRSEHRDGTSTLVALTGALVAEAMDLQEMGLHPTAIEEGYRFALGTARSAALDRAVPVEDVGAESVARTALTAVRDPGVRGHLAREVSAVATSLLTEHPERPFDRRNVAVVARVGGALSETELVHGVVLDKAPVVEAMPRTAEGGIGLVSATIDLPRPGSQTSRRPSTRLSIAPESFADRRAFDERERAEFEAAAERVIAAGCSFVATATSVNDRVKRTLANQGLLLVQRVEEDDLRRLARATGAAVVPSFEDLTAASLGSGTVTVRREAGRDMTVVESDAADRVYTLFCRAPDPRSLDEFSGSVESAVAAVTTATQAGTVVPGGGAAEVGADAAIRADAGTIDDRAQFAALAAGRALTRIPRQLARSGGMDPMEALADLRHAHAEGQGDVGVDVVLGELRSMFDTDPIVDPTATKVALWESAIDLAVQLVRIDERLPATDLGVVESATEGVDGAATED